MIPQPSRARRPSPRRGAVIPLFAILLPVMLVVAGLAINIAQLRLVKTEMRVATDAAAHAGGRALSIHQTTSAAVNKAKEIAALNSVNGVPLVITNDALVGFGFSTRSANGYGRYEFANRSRAAIDAGTQQVNSVSMLGQMNVPLMFRWTSSMGSVPLSAASIATQVDRDIGLVLDTSGSMLFYEDEVDWDYVFDDLRSRGRINSTDRDRAKNAFEQTHARSPFNPFPVNNNDSYPNGGSNSNFYISSTLWSRLTEDRNRDIRYTRVYEYIFDMAFVSNTRAPRHSRWAGLIQGVDAFLDVLDTTDQEELVSLATFDSSGRLNYSLMLDYTSIRSFVDREYPLGSTAIGQGINAAIPSIMTAAQARPYAAKTIVVLTDGQNNVNPTPQTAAQNMVNSYNITLHTVTFTPQADKVAMAATAQIGGGKHYHGDIGDDLVVIFEEIANNLPTILTF